jgi:hypothetical protein
LVGEMNDVLTGATLDNKIRGELALQLFF